LLPFLATAVFTVVVGAIAIVFWPRVAAWVDANGAVVVQAPPSPTETVPVWVCRTADGVALILEPGDANEERLNGALEGGPYHYLRLTVYNFDRPTSFVLDLPSAGLASPEGGPNARPAAALVPAGTEEHLRVVLRGLGAVERLAVERGRAGQALLVVPKDPSRRTAFVHGDLRFERREVQRIALAAWRRKPDLEQLRNL